MSRHGSFGLVRFGLVALCVLSEGEAADGVAGGDDVEAG